ncbi:uncharacterized protein LOC112464769 [Temnothorax curvispinosus]|uniref:Uncharacterized protein LOC112464769 n=1 Tax=Temnothorax curvispinosus TaxID=300111 RepID=A0A6J1R4D2_9HYME|nr:uncharacterized protein LOC112464769 [Temnothorax curvispinosus]
MCKKPADWKSELGAVQFVINNTFHRSINTTPSKLLLGYDQRRKSDNELRELIDRLTQVDVNIERERAELRDSAQIANRAVHEYNKVQYDRKHKKPTRYKEGDFVLVRVLQHKPGINQKLLPKYKGPYQIRAILNKNRFVVTDIPGYNLTSKPMNTILSSDKIKPWIKINETGINPDNVSDD